MKKQVNLKITSKQYVENLKPSGETFLRELEMEDSLEIMTEGTLYFKNNARYISYEESLDGESEDTRTLVKIDGKSLRIRRYDSKTHDDSMDMTLEQGVLNITRYQVPQLASLDLEIYTNKMEDSLDEDGYGTVSVDYKIKFDKYYSRRNILEIEVMPS